MILQAQPWCYWKMHFNLSSQDDRCTILVRFLMYHALTSWAEIENYLINFSISRLGAGFFYAGFRVYCVLWYRPERTREIYCGMDDDRKSPFQFYLRTIRRWTDNNIKNWRQISMELVEYLKTSIWHLADRKFESTEREKWLQPVFRSKMHAMVAHVETFVRTFGIWGKCKMSLLNIPNREERINAIGTYITSQFGHKYANICNNIG